MEDSSSGLTHGSTVAFVGSPLRALMARRNSETLIIRHDDDDDDGGDDDDGLGDDTDFDDTGTASTPAGDDAATREDVFADLRQWHTDFPAHTSPTRRRLQPQPPPGADGDRAQPLQPRPPAKPRKLPRPPTISDDDASASPCRPRTSSVRENKTTKNNERNKLRKKEEDAARKRRKRKTEKHS